MDVIEWTGVAAAACRDHHAMHNPSELGMLLHMLDTHQGRVILEIGACYGGSAWAWCQVPSVKKVITVDSGIRPEGREALAALPAAVLVEGDSADPATRQAVLDELGGDQADAVFIDGGHDYATARNDWFWYGQMCKPGGLVIFHDTQPGVDGIEVPRLWAQIREWRTLELVEKPGDKGCGIVWMPRGLPDAGLAAGQGRGRYHRVQHGQVDGQLHPRGAERLDADPRIRAVQADPQGQRADRHL